MRVFNWRNGKCERDRRHFHARMAFIRCNCNRNHIYTWNKREKLCVRFVCFEWVRGETNNEWILFVHFAPWRVYEMNYLRLEFEIVHLNSNKQFSRLSKFGSSCNWEILYCKKSNGIAVECTKNALILTYIFFACNFRARLSKFDSHWYFLKIQFISSLDCLRISVEAAFNNTFMFLLCSYRSHLSLIGGLVTVCSRCPTKKRAVLKSLAFF